LGEVSSIQERLVRITILGNEAAVAAGDKVIRLPHFYHESRWALGGVGRKETSWKVFANLTLLMTDVHLYSVVDPLGRPLRDLGVR
jgi:hypothetical protein